MCGIIGAILKKDFKNKNIIPKTIELLSKLQHRGQDSAGICFIQNNEFKLIKKLGLIKNALDNICDSSNIAIAHTRYKTLGDDSINCAQPFLYKDIALVHNGTVFNSEKYRKILQDNGFKFESNSDSEVILKWLYYKVKNWELKEISNVLDEAFNKSAYSIIILLKDKIMAFKDKNSYRPLTFFETQEAYFLSSEDININSVKKFELPAYCGIEIDADNYKLVLNKTDKTSFCVFEAVYFANPKHKVFNYEVKNIRIKLGEILAQNDLIKADYVVPVMNSGFFGAVGYSKKRNIPLKTLIKNKQNLRTFIEKEQNRDSLIENKYLINEKEIKDKKIILVDDSIVRGNTSRKLVELFKKAQAKEIHLRLTSPMIINSCYYGVDIPDKNELLAYNLNSLDNIKEELGVDSIKFISNYEFEKVFSTDKWCHKCFIATNNQE